MFRDISYCVYWVDTDYYLSYGGYQVDLFYQESLIRQNKMHWDIFKKARK